MHIAVTNFKLPQTEAYLPMNTYLSESLRLIIPRYACHSLNLDFLNNMAFSPESKDEDLHAGLLQVSDSTTLLMAEFGIAEGRINEKG